MAQICRSDTGIEAYVACPDHCQTQRTAPPYPFIPGTTRVKLFTRPRLRPDPRKFLPSDR